MVATAQTLGVWSPVTVEMVMPDLLVKIKVSITLAIKKYMFYEVHVLVAVQRCMSSMHVHELK